MFPRETIELIQKTACRAEAAQPLDVRDERHAHFRIGDQFRTVPIPPSPRAHRVDTLDDLAALAIDAVKVEPADTDQEISSTPSLWVGRESVVLLMDDADRRDRAVVALEYTKPFTTVEQLDDMGPLGQRPAVNVLRLRLGADDGLVAKFRKLDFEHTAAVRGNLQRGKESLGKETLSQVQQIDDIPQRFWLEVPVYTLACPDTTAKVQLAVDIDPSNQTIEFCAVPGELDRVRQAAQATVRGYLTEAIRERAAVLAELIPIYSGTP